MGYGMVYDELGGESIRVFPPDMTKEEAVEIVKTLSGAYRNAKLWQLVEPRPAGIYIDPPSKTMDWARQCVRTVRHPDEMVDK